MPEQNLLKLTYFRPNGTFYDEAKNVDPALFGLEGTFYGFELKEHIAKCRAERRAMPGLISAWAQGFILAESHDNEPVLLLPEAHP